MSDPQQPTGWTDPSGHAQQPTDPSVHGQQPTDPTALAPYGWATPDQSPGAAYPGSAYPGAGYPGAAYPEAGYPPAGVAYPVDQAGYGPAQPGYPPPGYGYPGYGYPAAPTATNGLAIASLIVSVMAVSGLCFYGVGGLLGVVGAILGHVARRQIRQQGGAGDGMALAGVITGWVATAIAVLAIIGIGALIASTTTGAN